MIFHFIKLDSYIQNVAAHEILRFPSVIKPYISR